MQDPEGEPDDVDHLVYDLVLRPSSGPVRDFRLHDDGIVHHLLSHRIFVSSRPAGADTYTVVGLIDWESQTLAVPAGDAVAEQGFLAALKLGVTHIAEGADHLLVLVMLLLPAPCWHDAAGGCAPTTSGAAASASSAW